MSCVVLVHWHADEAVDRLARLTAMGCDARHGGTDGAAVCRLIKQGCDAVVIDLARLPSHGREVARYLRERKATRGLPILFVPGEPEKTARARAEFPDCPFAAWPQLAGALRKLLAAPRREVARPAPRDYSHVPLSRKLGIGDGSRVVLLGAPRGFRGTLQPPAGAVVSGKLSGAVDVVLLFARSSDDLDERFAAAARALAPGGGLWVAWPKKAAVEQGLAPPTDLDQQQVQRFGLRAGLVDNKICAVDEVWSAQRFARRRA